MNVAEELSALSRDWGRVQAQQLLLVASGRKQACRLKMNRDLLPDLWKITRDLSLHMFVGYDAIINQIVPGRERYSEWSQRGSLSPKGEMGCYVYISTDRTIAQRLRRYDENHEEDAVGTLLGYPDCCIQAFCDSYRSSSLRGDPVLRSYTDTAPIDWHMNVSLLCFDCTLLLHVPCNQNCILSLNIARDYGLFFSLQAHAFAQETQFKLATWTLHTHTLGVIAFKGEERNGAIEVYRIVAFSRNSTVGHVLREGSVLRRTQEAISIDDFHLTGEEVRLFQYV